MTKSYYFALLAVAALGGLAFTKTSEKIEHSKVTLSEINPKDTTNTCDTISFNAEIMPMIYSNCVSCHGDLSNHKSIASDAKHIMKALKGVGASPMPKDAPPLNDSLIKKFQCWIDQGKLDN